MKRTAVRFVRAVGTAAFFAVFSLGGLALGAFAAVELALDGKRDRVRRHVHAAWRLFVWALAGCGLIRIEVDAMSRAALAQARGCVVVARHPTLLDVVVLMSLLGDATSLAKRDAARNPFYGGLVRAAFVEKGDAAQTLDEMRRLLAAGVNVLVFPEGTRTTAEDKRPFQRGAAHVALAARAPVLPVALTCSPPILDKRRPWWDVGDRTVVYRVCVGAPIAAEGPATHAGARALTARLEAAVDAAAVNF